MPPTPSHPGHRVSVVHRTCGGEHARQRRSSRARTSRSATPAPSPSTRRRSRRSTRCARRRRSTIRSAARWTRWPTRPASASRTNVDMGAFIIPGLPDMQDSFAADTLASADPFTMYDALAAVHRDGKMSVARPALLPVDGHAARRADAEAAADEQLQRLRRRHAAALRRRRVRDAAGRCSATRRRPTTRRRSQLVAKQGWAFQQHTLSPAEDKLTIETFEAVNKTTPIANLRWSIAHAPRIDAPTIDRFKAIGAGIAIHPFTYLAGRPGRGPAAADHRRQRHPRRRRLGLGADLDAQSVADDLLHGHRQELVRRR